VKGTKKEGEEEEEDGEEPNATEEVMPVIEPSTGPRYEKLLMLQVFQAVRSAGAAAPQVEEPAGQEELPGLSVKLSERPPEEPEPAKVSGSRKEAREQKKAEKIAKRATGPDSQDDEKPVSQQISLSNELPAAAYQAQQAHAHYEMALMTYLSSMYMAPPMQSVYGGPGLTTVMLRNIPNRYTRDMLLERLNQTYAGQFDFVYLPIDFNSKCNVGYAFINFRSPAACQRFYQEFHSAKTKSVLPGFSSSKVCEVSYARVQGRDANMDNLRDEKFIEKLNEKPEWQPLFYDDSGKEIPYAKTLGTGRKRSRAGSTTSPLVTSSMMPPAPPAFSMPSSYGGVPPPMMYPPGQVAPFAPMPPPEVSILSAALPKATSYTMQMLRNIPTSFTRAQLAEKLNESFCGTLDFLYLPRNEQSGGNRGFAFMNFKTRGKAQQFAKAFNGVVPSTCLGIAAEADAEEKPCEVISARMQNLEKSLERLRSAASQPDFASWCPVLLDSSGKETPFPLAPVPAPTAGVAGAASVAPMPAVPSQALDSRALEKQMAMWAGTGNAPSAPSGSKGKKGKAKAAAGAPPAAQGYPNYPGYPGYMDYPRSGMPLAHPAYAQAMAQVAHQHARAAAAAHAAHAGLLDPLAAAVNPVPGKPLEEGQRSSLIKQIEFYFSAENLCKDTYLRGKMDDNGFTPLEVISTFPKVRAYKANQAEIAEALKNSEILEVDTAGKSIRLKNEEARNKFAKIPEEYRNTFVPKKGQAKEKRTEEKRSEKDAVTDAALAPSSPS